MPRFLLYFFVSIFVKPHNENHFPVNFKKPFPVLFEKVSPFIHSMCAMDCIIFILSLIFTFFIFINITFMSFRKLISITKKNSILYRGMAVCVQLSMGRLGSIVGSNIVGYSIYKDCLLTFSFYSGFLICKFLRNLW